MLKFGGRTETGEAVIGLVLSRENLERLYGGEPVLVAGADVGADGVVVILHVTDQAEAEIRVTAAMLEAHGRPVRDLEEVLGELESGPWIEKEGGARAPCGCEWSIAAGRLLVVACKGRNHEREMATRGQAEAEGRSLALDLRQLGANS